MVVMPRKPDPCLVRLSTKVAIIHNMHILYALYTPFEYPWHAPRLPVQLYQKVRPKPLYTDTSWYKKTHRLRWVFCYACIYREECARF